MRLFRSCCAMVMVPSASFKLMPVVNDSTLNPMSPIMAVASKVTILVSSVIEKEPCDHTAKEINNSAKVRCNVFIQRVIAVR